jgi:hypothetical protein
VTLDELVEQALTEQAKGKGDQEVVIRTWKPLLTNASYAVQTPIGYTDKEIWLVAGDRRG